MVNIKYLILNNWKLVRCSLALENVTNEAHCSLGPCAAPFPCTPWGKGNAHGVS